MVLACSQPGKGADEFLCKPALLSIRRATLARPAPECQCNLCAEGLSGPNNMLLACSQQKGVELACIPLAAILQAQVQGSSAPLQDNEGHPEQPTHLMVSVNATWTLPACSQPAADGAGEPQRQPAAHLCWTSLAALLCERVCVQGVEDGPEPCDGGEAIRGGCGVAAPRLRPGADRWACVAACVSAASTLHKASATGLAAVPL